MHNTIEVKVIVVYSKVPDRELRVANYLLAAILPALYSDIQVSVCSFI